MKLKNQVVSLEIAKRLKELGVKQQSLLWWYPTEKEYALTFVRFGLCDYDLTISAFTVAELGEMLPRVHFMTWKNNDNSLQWVCKFWSEKSGNKEIYVNTTEADARGKMLIYLIENKLITL